MVSVNVFQFGSVVFTKYFCCSSVKYIRSGPNANGFIIFIRPGQLDDTRWFIFSGYSTVCKSSSIRKDCIQSTQWQWIWHGNSDFWNCLWSKDKFIPSCFHRNWKISWRKMDVNLYSFWRWRPRKIGSKWM